MIAIWFNPHKHSCYCKVLKNAYFNREYKVGYINKHNHELIALFYISKNKLIKCDSLVEFYNWKREHCSIKLRLINRLIDLLNRMKGEKVKNGH